MCEPTELGSSLDVWDEEMSPGTSEVTGEEERWSPVVTCPLAAPDRLSAPLGARAVRPGSHPQAPCCWDS